MLRRRVGADNSGVNSSHWAVKTGLLTVALSLIADDKKEKNPSAGEKTGKPGAASKPPTTPTKPPKSNPAPSAPAGVNLEKVDLGKISSILSSLTSAMKNTGRNRGTGGAVGVSLAPVVMANC